MTSMTIEYVLMWWLWNEGCGPRGRAGRPLTGGSVVQPARWIPDRMRCESLTTETKCDVWLSALSFLVSRLAPCTAASQCMNVCLSYSCTLWKFILINNCTYQWKADDSQMQFICASLLSGMWLWPLAYHICIVILICVFPIRTDASGLCCCRGLDVCMLTSVYWRCLEEARGVVSGASREDPRVILNTCLHIWSWNRGA